MQIASGHEVGEKIKLRLMQVPAPLRSVSLRFHTHCDSHGILEHYEFFLKM